MVQNSKALRDIATLSMELHLVLMATRLLQPARMELLNFGVLKGTLIKTFIGHTDRVWSVAFHPDLEKEILVSGSWDKTVRLWKSDNGLVRTLGEHDDAVIGVDFNPRSDGDYQVVSGSDDETVKLWSTQSKTIKTLRGDYTEIYGVAYDPNGDFIAAASNDRKVNLWANINAEPLNLKDHKNEVWAVDFSGNGQWIASGGKDRIVRLWDANGNLLNSFDMNKQTYWVNLGYRI